MGGSVIGDIQREPVTFQIDEAGMAVYTLPNYLSARFKEIFDHIDADMQRYGIKSYKIRNMTLEQVFINIGLEETK